MAKVSGKTEALARLRGLGGRQMIESVGQALFVAGDEVRAEAAHLITEGAVSGKGHVPSAPGQPPNEDTGHLRTNIEVAQAAPLRVEVSSNAEYSAALEYGTSKMAARPFMAPALRNKQKRVVELVSGAVKRATERK